MPWLHHILNHFPIAVSALAAVALVIAWVRPGDAIARASRWTVYLTAASAILASGTGLFSAGHVIEMGAEPASVELHRNLALGGTLLSVLAAASMWIDAKRRHRGAATLALIASVGATGAIAVAGHLGGDMLHPGLAPWSNEPHHHGPAEAADPGGGHAHPEPPTTTEAYSGHEHSQHGHPGDEHSGHQH